MNYYLLSVEANKAGRKIKVSLILMVVVVIIITTILGIQLAVYLNKQRFLASLAKNSEYMQNVEEQIRVEEENKIQEEVASKVPIIPNFAEQTIQNFNNIYNSEEKIAYLTFDDGPSRTVTPLILDILKQNEISATFFVLGSRVSLNPDIVKRAYDEGHYIANHSYTHVYKNIYSGKEAVLGEYNSTEAAIKSALGLEEYNSHIFRFPGGSKGGGTYGNVKKEAKQFLLDNGVLSLDWNSLTGDSEGKYTKEALLEHLHYTSEGKGNVVVVLMHDANDKILTAETLQDVINMLRDKGFTFKNLYNLYQ